TLRYHADEEYRIQTDLAALASYPNYGEAIRKFREENNLTQEVVAVETGFSTRHLSRVENSEQRLTSKLMEKLASYHDLSFDEYIKKLVRICADVEKAELKRRRLNKK